MNLVAVGALALGHWTRRNRICKWSAGHSGPVQAIRTSESESNDLETLYETSYATWCRKLRHSAPTISWDLRHFTSLHCRSWPTMSYLNEKYDIVGYILGHIGIIRYRWLDLLYSRSARIQMKDMDAIQLTSSRPTWWASRKKLALSTHSPRSSVLTVSKIIDNFNCDKSNAR